MIPSDYAQQIILHENVITNVSS